MFRKVGPDVEGRRKRARLRKGHGLDLACSQPPSLATLAPSVPIFIGWFEAGAFWADFLRKSLGPLSERHRPVRGAFRRKRGGLGGRSPNFGPPSESWVPWRHLFRRAIRKPPRKIGTLLAPPTCKRTRPKCPCLRYYLVTCQRRCIAAPPPLHLCSPTQYCLLLGWTAQMQGFVVCTLPA